MLFEFKKKKVEGYLFTVRNGQQLANWCGGELIGHFRTLGRIAEKTETIEIKTIYGKRVAHPGKYIINVDGDFLVLGRELVEVFFKPFDEMETDLGP